jgi:hypothetical protein
MGRQCTIYVSADNLLEVERGARSELAEVVVDGLGSWAGANLCIGEEQMSTETIAGQRLEVRQTLPPQRWWCGEDHAQHKLTEKQVVEIKELALRSANQPNDNRYTTSSPSLREIGLMFGVSKATVFDIKHSRIWKHLWDDAPTENKTAEGVTANTE